ncbi:MAG: SAVED domain-containing protein [Deltaproteobacteria bacterium]|nr:SAVED domain-containing protein [Deltaproteobacteria bacterium]
MWETIARTSDIAGIITFIVFVATVLIVLSRALRYKRRIKKAIERGKGLCVALVVSLKPGENIRGHVETYLKEKGMTMEISEIDKKGVSIHTISEMRKDFIRKKRELTERGVKEVHLFYEGPVASAFFLADCLNNWVPVYIYHFHRDGGYECWGLLTESLERIATEELIREVTKDA